MISVKTEYYHNGKKVKSFADMLMKGLVDTIKKDIDKKLAPLQKEINAEKGTIKIHIGDNIKVTTEGFSKELDNKIEKAFK